MSNESKSATNKLLVAAGLLVIAAAVLFLLTRGGGTKTPTKTPPQVKGTVPAAAPDTARAPRLAKQTGDEPARPPGDDGATPVPKDVERDHTGEPLSAGPAKMDKTPPKVSDPTENIPSKKQTDDAFARILTRIDDDIAKAKAAGDDDRVRRLKVRKARIEQKRKIKMAEDPPKPVAKPEKRPDTPPRPPEE